MTVQLHLSGISSLKEKRSIVKSVISRLRNRYNVSVAEVGHHDSKQSAIIGFSAVANETDYVNSRLDEVLTFMHRDGRFYLGQVERETFS